MFLKDVILLFSTHISFVGEFYQGQIDSNGLVDDFFFREKRILSNIPLLSSIFCEKMDKINLHKGSVSSSSEHCPKYSFHNLWSTVNNRTPFTATKNGGKFKKNCEIPNDDEEKGKLFSDLGEKLFRHSNNRMSRSSRRSLCKSTISSHDSGRNRKIFIISKLKDV
uniref:Uncharacterized protein n=1 Tax=Romanomermis culicivorax TaxID=13658 RepID=A0A915JS07_ROMCU